MELGARGRAPPVGRGDKEMRCVAKNDRCEMRGREHVLFVY